MSPLARKELGNILNSKGGLKRKDQCHPKFKINFSCRVSF